MTDSTTQAQLQTVLEQGAAIPTQSLFSALEPLVWAEICVRAGQSFYTAKQLEFTYRVKGNEIFISRKEKSITRSTVTLALKKALELNRIVTGPKKLGTFGASYLYPIFLQLGVITAAKK
jgi:hypothetical protein